MRFSLGTCEEYTNVSDQVLFSPATDSSNGRPLAQTPNADFCVSGSENVIYWLSALNVCPLPPNPHPPSPAQLPPTPPCGRWCSSWGTSCGFGACS